MFFCPKCERPVGLVYEETIRKLGEKGCEEFVWQQVEEGRIVLFYPPPEGPYACPHCGTTLEDI